MLLRTGYPLPPDNGRGDTFFPPVDGALALSPIKQQSNSQVLGGVPEVLIYLYAGIISFRIIFIR
jgi:hypothetical protein